jgi:hypothetical protein
MTDIHDSTNLQPIQRRPATLPLTAQRRSFKETASAAADCYQLRAELIEAEANAATEQEADELMDQRLDADNEVWSAPIRDERDILAKIAVMAGLVQSMTAADMLPFMGELFRQVAEFAQAAV